MAPEPASDPRLERLAACYGLSEPQRGQLAALLMSLAVDLRAPTSVYEPEVAIDVHLADSLSALELDLDLAITNVVDVGSGAGFPGLPLAIARPAWTVCMLESQSRKCSFIERAALTAGIANARVIHARAEEWSAGMAASDLVLTRAVASQPVVLEYAAPLLRRGGMLIDWRGRRDQIEELDSEAAAEILGLRLVAVRAVKPFDGALHRHLHLYVKVRDTPDRFPRRPGMARKRALGRAIG
jgi:16S rRNA (guanine527-N7)-methyltransferase